MISISGMIRIEILNLVDRKVVLEVDIFSAIDERDCAAVKLSSTLWICRYGLVCQD